MTLYSAHTLLAKSHPGKLNETILRIIHIVQLQTDKYRLKKIIINLSVLINSSKFKTHSDFVHTKENKSGIQCLHIPAENLRSSRYGHCKDVLLSELQHSSKHINTDIVNVCVVSSALKLHFCCTKGNHRKADAGALEVI